MEKPASGWFLHWSSTTRDTWGIFREHVLQHFEASNYQSVLREKLQRLKQTVDIETYNGEYSALIFRVERMSVLDQVLCYANGLKSRTRSYVKLENPETLSEAMDVAVKRWVNANKLETTKFSDKNIRVKLGDNQIVEAELEVLPLEIMDLQPQIDWRARQIEGTKTKTLRWERSGETCGPIEEGGPVITSGLRRSVEAKDLSAKRPDSCRGAAQETDVKSAVQPDCEAVQRDSPSVVREQQGNAAAGKGSVVKDGVEPSERRGTAREARDSSSTKGKETIVEKMFTIGIVNETGVQTKYITRKKLWKFLRIKTKSSDEPGFMLVLSNETIKQVERSLQ
ncbi:hypothetical protein PC117_g6648 [Phytophthora cactorum]|uniref:Ty3 transposon capsid-like protein domain-containing protein n=2 Tax=Phytophthora cactorum TaxID=29920 RepID=A0A8T1E0K9_9STRA|nr:hypothetical protein PC117_g6648 [Phytophthora cactorum]KAG4054339.1 hypothetical protein PC123_g10553 [Phytophthora cactorum]